MSDIGVQEYLWMERAKSPSRVLALERGRQRVGARWSVLVLIASVVLCAVTWPPAPVQAVTKRVSWPECVPLLTIYGKRCN